MATPLYRTGSGILALCSFIVAFVQIMSISHCPSANPNKICIDSEFREKVRVTSQAQKPCGWTLQDRSCFFYFFSLGPGDCCECLSSHLRDVANLLSSVRAHLPPAVCCHTASQVLNVLDGCVFSEILSIGARLQIPLRFGKTYLKCFLSLFCSTF